jgi:hypothetical protein
MSKKLIFSTAGGRIICAQCQATAKSTKQQCLRPATRGKRVCKLHGGASTGPKTEQGRRRCAQVKTVRGDETTIKRTERSEASARLAVLEMIGHSLGFMHGPRTRGRKPDQMMHAYPELQVLSRELIGKRTKPGK